MQLHSESIDQITTALSIAQGTLEAAKKDKKVEAGKMTYSYADINGCLETLREPLRKNGLSVVQSVADLEGKTYFVTTLYHNSGQWLRSYCPFNQANTELNMKTLGSAITYLRRYMLNAMMGLGQEDDDGAKASTQRPSGPVNYIATVSPASRDTSAEEPAEQLYNRCLKENIPAKAFWDFFGLSRDDPKEILNVINNFGEYKIRFHGER